MSNETNETKLTEKQIAAVFAILSVLVCRGVDTLDIVQVAAALNVLGCDYADFLWVYNNSEYGLSCLEKYAQSIASEINKQARDINNEQNEQNKVEVCSNKDKSLN